MFLSRIGRRRLLQQTAMGKAPAALAEEYGLTIEQAERLVAHIDQDTLDANTPADDGRLFGSGKLLMLLKDALNWLASDEGQKAVANLINLIKTLAAAFGGLPVKQTPVSVPK